MNSFGALCVSVIISNDAETCAARSYYWAIHIITCAVAIYDMAAPPFALPLYSRHIRPVADDVVAVTRCAGIHYCDLAPLYVCVSPTNSVLF